MRSDLENAVVLITGASGGIGRACAEAFAAERARLVLSGYSHMERVEELAANLDADTLVVEADVSDEGAVASLFEQAVGRFDRLDAVVANAGVWPPDDVPIHNMSLQQWHDTVSVNLTGTFLCARAYFRYLERARPETASLVIIGSTAAMFGEEGHADYSATKAGITHGLTKTLKNEIVRLVPRGRVNAVCPGWTLTRMTEDALSNYENVVPTLQTRALTRIARARDVANAVIYFASDRLSGHVTGEVLTVAGGMEGRLLHRAEDVDPTRA